MRKLLPFLACLMLVLTGWSGMLHAAEAAMGSVAGIEMTMHAAGDGDEVPADGDDGLPHHHSVCHGHDIGTPMPAPAQMTHVRKTALCSRSAQPALVSADQGVSLRPPQA